MSNLASTVQIHRLNPYGIVSCDVIIIIVMVLIDVILMTFSINILFVVVANLLRVRELGRAHSGEHMRT